MLMTPLIALLAHSAQPTTGGFKTLWLDWRSIGREASAAELAPAAQAPHQGAKAAALGERVGEVVAGGDCATGERLARQAGDIPLARAVREHCYGQDPVPPPPTR